MAGFVQIIEFQTSRRDEVETLLEEFRSRTADKRTSIRAYECSDRDRPNTYVTMVEFPSYEAATQNSQLPETAQFAEQMGKLCDGPPAFRNLDLIQRLEG
jgi:quinol monooxygenase YgiN